MVRNLYLAAGCARIAWLELRCENFFDSIGGIGIRVEPLVQILRHLAYAMCQYPGLSHLPDMSFIGVLQAVFCGADGPLRQEMIRTLRSLDVQIKLSWFLLRLDQVNIVFIA